MRRAGMTRLDAAHEWVREFNSFPYGMIEALRNADYDSWTEVTKPSAGDRVYVYDVPEGYSNEGTIENYDMESDLYFVEPDKGEMLSLEADDFEVERDGGLPMWGTLWSFGDRCDDWWLEEGDGIQVMSDCGFRIYEHEEFGYIFGIDGAGYDFYEAHWLPLYNKRGLRWHDERTDDPEYKPRDYDPVYKAYEIVEKLVNGGEGNLPTELEEVLGYLGEALE